MKWIWRIRLRKAACRRSDPDHWRFHRNGADLRSGFFPILWRGVVATPVDGQVAEFKTMVRRLHRTGIEVTMDIAEPRDLGEGGYQVGNFPALWAEWNGIYRDTVSHSRPTRSTWNGNCVWISDSRWESRPSAWHCPAAPNTGWRRAHWPCSSCEERINSLSS